jgi:hypothetical protein
MRTDKIYLMYDESYAMFTPKWTSPAVIILQEITDISIQSEKSSVIVCSFIVIIIYIYCKIYLII